jgi:3'-5' exoribonuclease 1
VSAVDSAYVLNASKTLGLSSQLRALGLGEFIGRQHRGSDVSIRFTFYSRVTLTRSPQDAHNIARILKELVKLGIVLRPNTPMRLDRRWRWMGKSGMILDEFVLSLLPASPPA